MKKLFLFSLAICVSLTVMAQDEPMAVETLNILPKRGMNNEFETAVKAHNVKFHKDGLHKAGLRRVDYGKNAGWYVWVMGPTSYAALDSRPAGKGHDDDWSKTIDPLVEEYGEVSLFNYNAALSYGADILQKSSKYEVWAIDIKRGQYYRFKAIAEKLKTTYESIGTNAFMIFNNQVHTAGGADVGMLWSFNTYQEWSKNAGAKAVFEKTYGEGSWQRMLDEWNDILVDYDAELRTIIK